MEGHSERERDALALADEIQMYADVPPSAQRTSSEWVERFRRFGFFRAVRLAATLAGTARMIHFVSFTDARPREAATIFRVCDPDRVTRVSWTSMLSMAMKYAPGGQKSSAVSHSNARLFSALVEPQDVLAVLNDYEWIVDPQRLRELTDHGTVSAIVPVKRLGELAEHPLKAALLEELGPDYPVQMLDADGPYLIHHVAGVPRESEADCTQRTAVPLRNVTNHCSRSGERKEN